MQSLLEGIGNSYYYVFHYFKGQYYNFSTNINYEYNVDVAVLFRIYYYFKKFILMIILIVLVVNNQG